MNKTINEALLICQDGNELAYGYDEVSNQWIVFYNIDVLAVDEMGEPCESGMRSIEVAKFNTRKECEDYIDDVENLWDHEDGNYDYTPPHGSIYGEPCGDRK